MDDTTPTRASGARWLRVALGLSLGANLLIVGIVAGAVISHRPDGPRRGMTGPGDLGPYGRAFAYEDRAALREALGAAAPRQRENRAAVRQGFRDVLTALRAEPYDGDRVRALMEAQQARVQDQIELGRAAMLARLEAMTPAERAAFADRLERVLRRGPPRHERLPESR